MNFTDALRYAGPLLVQGLKWYAPQVGVPVEVINFAVKNIRKARKSKEKLRKKILKIDNRLEDLEREERVLRLQRANLIEQWSQIDGMIEQINKGGV